MDKELETLIHRLGDNRGGCEDKCLDLQTLKFATKEGEMRLYNESHSYYFKYDPKNPKDAKVTHAAKQFCGLMEVPFPFFFKNPEFMKNEMVNCWLPTISPEAATVMAKLRRAKEAENYIIRAILPVEFANIMDVDVMTMVGEAVGDCFRTEFIIGDGRDDLLLHVRFVHKDEFEVCGESCSTGFSVMTSELGGAPFTVETLLFRNSSKASMLASYLGGPYFESDYTGIQPADLKALFPKLLDRLTQQLPQLKDRIYAAKSKVTKKEDVKQLLGSLHLRKGLNDKFHRRLFQEIEKNPVENRWEFVNRMAILAKDFDAKRRLTIERVAGEMIDLMFEKD